MAERPVFIPSPDDPGFVKEVSLSIPWASGFAVIQKQKNIASLHKAAAVIGLSPILEVSTKSDEKAGRHLSAFNLRIETGQGAIPLECIFQGSKCFDKGGPYTDLYLKEPKDAKKDSRLHNSGQLLGFQFNGISFPLEPKTVFYDWLYITAIYPYRDWLKNRLQERREYAGFTDIEFNPSKSVNCQARSCALFISLICKDLIDKAARSAFDFIDIISASYGNQQQISNNGIETHEPVLALAGAQGVIKAS